MEGGKLLIFRHFLLQTAADFLRSSLRRQLSTCTLFWLGVKSLSVRLARFKTDSRLERFVWFGRFGPLTRGSAGLCRIRVRIWNPRKLWVSSGFSRWFDFSDSSYDSVGVFGGKYLRVISILYFPVVKTR